MLSPEQIKERLKYITGSDAAIICGHSKYCTPYKLWEYKTGRDVAPDISHKAAVKAGNMLEGAIRDWLAKEIGKEIQVQPMMITNREYPWMAGNIDGSVVGEDAIVEIKTSSSDTDWGDDGTASIPYHYHLQCAHYMAVTGASRCYVGVLIRGVDFRHYVIERNLALEEWLIEKEKAFYECMANDTPPPIETIDDALCMWNHCKLEESVKINEGSAIFVEQYLRTRSEIKELEATLEEAKQMICNFMGPAQVLENEHGRVLATWKRPKQSEKIDELEVHKKYPTIYEQCCVKFDEKYLKHHYPKVYNELVKMVDNSRRFLVKDLDQ